MPLGATLRVGGGPFHDLERSLQVRGLGRPVILAPLRRNGHVDEGDALLHAFGDRESRHEEK